jgi:hypothetical protein
VCRMNENEPELLDGLRALALAEPREASLRVEQKLVANFRIRAQRRRRARWGYSAAAFAAVAALLAILLWTPAANAHKSAPIAVRGAIPSTPDTQIPAASPAVSEPQVRFAVVRTEDLSASFYPLPEAEALPPLETSMVVRVEMPVSSLRLMGVPVEEDLSAGPLQADVLLGQDGLARGVRLVQ